MRYEFPKPTVGEVLNDMLQERGITIRELADAINVHRNTVSNLINDRNGMRVGMALKLGKALGTGHNFWLKVHVDYLKYQAAFIGEDDRIKRIKPLVKENPVGK